MKNLIIFALFIITMISFLSKEQVLTNHPLNDIEEIQDYKSQKVIIRGLSSFNSEDLLKAKKLIEENFHFNCEIGDPIQIKKNKYPQYSCQDIQAELGYQNSGLVYEPNKIIEIYVTNLNLFSLGIDVKGVCFGNQIYVQSYPTFESTLIHELTHIFIYEHCKNECIMNSHSKSRWDLSSNRPRYCSSCRSKLPL